MVNKLTTFLKETQLELKKVTWPTREETIRYTVMVIVISVVVAIFLGVLDYIFRFVLETFVL